MLLAVFHPVVEDQLDRLWTHGEKDHESHKCTPKTAPDSY